MTKHPLVSIIIVNLNGGDYLRQCLQPIQTQNYPNIETIVVDNGSIDGSIKTIEKYKPIRLVKNKANLGFAKPSNQGYEVSKGKYIFFLNNDAYIKRNTISKAVNYLEKNPKVAVVQNQILLAENPRLTDSTGSFMTNTGFLIHEGHAEPIKKSTHPKEVFSIKGASMFVRRESIEKVLNKNLGETGPFDEDFRYYFEETDLCWRIILAGFRVVFLPIGITFHHLGKTSRKQKSSSIQFHSFKNRINSLIKNLSLLRLITTLPVHLFLVLLIALANLFLLRIGNFFAILAAIFWNILNLPKTLKKRVYIQKNIRKISDKFIFSNLSKPFNLKWALSFGGKYLKN